MRIYRRLISKPNKALPKESGKELNSRLLSFAKQTPVQCLKDFKTTSKGLSPFEVRRRLLRYGKNEVVREKKRTWISILAKNVWDPLSILLIALAAISLATRDIKATTIISVMVVLSVFIRFFQELKADTAAKKLKAMVHTVARVVRNGKEKDIPLSHLVPGDIVVLSAGDMIPADLRLLSSKDLFVNQATLTGESIPAEKHAIPVAGHLTDEDSGNSLYSQTLCFLGTNVENGTAQGLVLSTGQDTYLGLVAESITEAEEPSSFDIGIQKFTWLILKFILIMVPLVFLINGLSKGDWFEAFLFALAVAVGLTPEMLPMIVAVNLSKGALDMSQKKVIVKHLDSIQNFGAMDVLCTDKTGTITQGKVILEKYLNICGNEDLDILRYAFLNSYFQTGLHNLLDAAVLKHTEWTKKLNIKKNFKKIDEIPFDFSRRRMSVVVQEDGLNHLLICKGAVEEVMAICQTALVNGKSMPMEKAKCLTNVNIEEKLNREGFRIVAVAVKSYPEKKSRYNTADEKDLTLLGFLAFLDPPKESAKKTIKDLVNYGIAIKILTGDNDLVTGKICAEVGIPAEKILLGDAIEKMSEPALRKAVEKHSIFAKLTPHQKERIVRAIRKNGHSVGFMGDGINDSPALRAADVGISVDTAVDIAKESSDIILLEKDLSVLMDGVVEGRKIFGNIIKYIQMAASSNFGNMFSVLGASIFLPFLPMLPLQILTNNLLYDASQAAIPTDNIDQEYVKKPRQWRIDYLRRFIMFIGPISSLFDYTTYFVMLYVFNAWANPSLFHTGWFVESLVSQTLIIHIIRTNKIPFLQSRASWPLTLTTISAITVGAYLPYSPLAETLGFTPLPLLYWPILLGIIMVYFTITQLIKNWFVKKYKDF